MPCRLSELQAYTNGKRYQRLIKTAREFDYGKFEPHIVPSTKNLYVFFLLCVMLHTCSVSAIKWSSFTKFLSVYGFWEAGRAFIKYLSILSTVLISEKLLSNSILKLCHWLFPLSFCVCQTPAVLQADSETHQQVSRARAASCPREALSEGPKNM